MSFDHWKPHPSVQLTGSSGPLSSVPSPATPSIVPLPRDQWPLVVKAMAIFRKETDKGVGDTLQRWAAKLGGEVFKEKYQEYMGEDCGCGNRQERMNLRYPYEQK